MLVYEYISNSSLDKWIDEDNLLDWDQRMCIIIGVVQGLAHLHKYIVNFNFYTRNKRIYGTRNSFKVIIDK
ncbi:unnamed protein product [Sphagnum jensenii]